MLGPDSPDNYPANPQHRSQRCLYQYRLNHIPILLPSRFWRFACTPPCALTRRRRASAILSLPTAQQRPGWLYHCSEYPTLPSRSSTTDLTSTTFEPTSLLGKLTAPPSAAHLTLCCRNILNFAFKAALLLDYSTRLLFTQPSNPQPLSYFLNRIPDIHTPSPGVSKRCALSALISGSFISKHHPELVLLPPDIH